LPVGAGTLTVETVSWDAEQRRFSGTLAASTPDGPVRIAVSGRAEPLVEVPVLNRAINPGEFVGIADLDLVPMAADRVARDTLKGTEDIVGRPAERLLEPGRPLRSHDLKRNLLIRRGETVTLMLDDPSLSLTVQGRALTDGAKGEPVKVLNLASSRVVEGVAAASDLVTVSEYPQPVPGAAGVELP
jgi:flagella basal body P-ring formation protein FlgA